MHTQEFKDQISRVLDDNKVWSVNKARHNSRTNLSTNNNKLYKQFEWHWNATICPELSRDPDMRQ